MFIIVSPKEQKEMRWRKLWVTTNLFWFFLGVDGEWWKNFLFFVIFILQHISDNVISIFRLWESKLDKGQLLEILLKWNLINLIYSGLGAVEFSCLRLGGNGSCVKVEFKSYGGKCLLYIKINLFSVMSHEKNHKKMNTGLRVHFSS